MTLYPLHFITSVACSYHAALLAGACMPSLTFLGPVLLLANFLSGPIIACRLIYVASRQERAKNNHATLRGSKLEVKMRSDQTVRIRNGMFGGMRELECVMLCCINRFPGPPSLPSSIGLTLCKQIS